MPYSRKRRRKKKRGSWLQEPRAKKESKEPTFTDRDKIANAFRDMVAAKPQSQDSWDDADKKSYFDVKVSSIENMRERAGTVIYINWSFVEGKRYCCITPSCFLGWKGPKKIAWWSRFREALQKHGLDMEKMSKPITLSLNVLIPEVKIRCRDGRYDWIGPTKNQIIHRESHALDA